MKWHRLLERQITRYLERENLPLPVSKLLNVINNAYFQADRDRELLERSLEITSQELSERNAELQQQLQAIGQTQKALSESHSLLEATLNASQDGLLALDNNGLITRHNRKLLLLLGIADKEPIQTLAQLMSLVQGSFQQPELLINEIDRVRTHNHKTGYCELSLKNGHTLEAYSNPQKIGDEVIGQVWSFRDISILKYREDEARHRAYHDMLTGLPNRLFLREKLLEWNADAEKGKQVPLSLMFLDLDGFKDVNDSLGHNIGDTLLREVSERIHQVMRPGFHLIRQGGDEFIILIRQALTESQLGQIAQRVLSVLEPAFLLSNEEVYISASIGIVSQCADESNADSLVQKADMAMYQAKSKGKNNFQFYQESLEQSSRRRMRLKAQLKTALENDEFHLVFQPKVCLNSGRIKGAEALIRWQDENGQYRNPIEFITVAEESGQILDINRWVIRRACLHLNRWLPHLSDEFTLAINISAKHFHRGDLTADLVEVLGECKTPAHRLELEVTETAVMENVSNAIRTLEELRTLGIRTAIDDFGTGYSSLSYLRKLPIEILKIDKSFIDEILDSNEDRILVRGIIEMVQELGISVVAEGIENQQIASLLNEMGCNLAQGYYFCKPLDEEAFLTLLANDSQLPVNNFVI